jgi:hypothetical protein
VADGNGALVPRRWQEAAYRIAARYAINLPEKRYLEARAANITSSLEAPS